MGDKTITEAPKASMYETAKSYSKKGQDMIVAGAKKVGSVANKVFQAIASVAITLFSMVRHPVATYTAMKETGSFKSIYQLPWGMIKETYSARTAPVAVEATELASAAE